MSIDGWNEIDLRDIPTPTKPSTASSRRGEVLQAKFMQHLHPSSIPAGEQVNDDRGGDTSSRSPLSQILAGLGDGELVEPDVSVAAVDPVDQGVEPPSRRFPTWRRRQRRDEGAPTGAMQDAPRWAQEFGRPARGLSSRGWLGKGATGRTSWVEPALEWRGTSVQVCGLWPWGAGTGTPNVGTPVGRRIGSGPASGETVHCDPMAWFKEGFISNPSCSLMGLNGRGKSSFLKRMLLGMSAAGVRPIIPGDIRPDYVALVRAIGGQVIRAGRGVGTLNPLEPGAMVWAANQLSGEAKRAFTAELRGQQSTSMFALLALVRKRPLEDYEESAVAALIETVCERHQGTPVPADLLVALQQRPERVRAALVDNGDDEVYAQMTAPLVRTLNAMLNGPFGDVFSGHNSERMSLDAPGICIDISAIANTDRALEGAALLTSWSHGFGTIRAMLALSDAGLRPFVHYFAVLDEFWKALRSGNGMAGRVDEITRLNREGGYGQAIITHTVKDYDSLPLESDRAIARGFIERSGFLATCASTPDEMRALSQIVPFTRAEQREVTSWATVESFKMGEGSTPANARGKGKFLLKVGERPGVPVQVALTPCEEEISNTNHRWEMAR